MFRRKVLIDLADRGPLRVMFIVTSMPVGGAETLLVELIRRLDRKRFLPELCCLKDLGPLGETLSREVPAHHGLLTRKTGGRRAHGHRTLAWRHCCGGGESTRSSPLAPATRCSGGAWLPAWRACR